MTVTLNLTDKEARTLYWYVQTMIDGDDSYDETRQTIVETLEKMDNQL